MKKAIVGNLVKFTFDDGVPAYTFDATKASGTVRDRAILVGFSHSLGDSAALMREVEVNGVKTVRTITEAMRREAVAEKGDWFMSGTLEWNMKSSKARNPIWEAIAAKRGMTYEEYCAERAAKDLAELAEME